jgi:hypothetical protein
MNDKMSTKGTSVVSYSPGDVIQVSYPLIHILSYEMRGSLCDSCFKTSDSLKRCSGCRVVMYCGQECQKTDWKSHHKHGECITYKKVQNGNDNFFLNNHALLLLRVYLTLEARKELLDKEFILPDQTLRTFRNLMTHVDKIMEDEERMKCFHSLLKILQPLVPDLNTELLLIFFGKICINSFSILDNSLNEIGSAVYVEASIFNHSCDPNATTVWDGLKLEIRAIKHISAGHEICTNYIDIKKPRDERLKQLKKLYYFDCVCKRCLSDDDGIALWTEVNTFNQMMDQLMVEKEISQEKFKDMYLLGLQTLPLYEKVYGEFHPDLTIQLFRIMKARALFDSRESSAFLGNKLLSSLEVTHGRHHSLFKEFQQQFM